MIQDILKFVPLPGAVPRQCGIAGFCFIMSQLLELLDRLHTHGLDYLENIGSSATLLPLRVQWAAPWLLVKFAEGFWLSSPADTQSISV